MGWVCETENVLKDYNFPGMLGKMHVCVVSVYQALSQKRREPGYEAIFECVREGLLFECVREGLVFECVREGLLFECVREGLLYERGCQTCTCQVSLFLALSPPLPLLV